MKTIALIGLLFTFSQHPRCRQLGLSLSPDRPTGPRPTSSGPSDSNGPYGPTPGTDLRHSAASTDSNIQDKTTGICVQEVFPREGRGLWTPKLVWVSLSSLLSQCCRTGNVPRNRSLSRLSSEFPSGAYLAMPGKSKELPAM